MWEHRTIVVICYIFWVTWQRQYLFTVLNTAIPWHGSMLCLGLQVAYTSHEVCWTTITFSWTIIKFEWQKVGPLLIEVEYTICHKCTHGYWRTGHLKNRTGHDGSPVLFSLPGTLRKGQGIGTLTQYKTINVPFARAFTSNIVLRKWSREAI